MRIIHTADWHLGNNFHRHDRTPEFQHFLNWLLTVLESEQPDALLIAGDVFDVPNVSAAAMTLFYDFLHSATEKIQGLQIVTIAGNHDSGGRLEAPQALLKHRNIYLRGVVHRNEDDRTDYEHYVLPLSTKEGTEAQAVCFAIPYLRSGDYPAGMTVKEGLQDFVNGMYAYLKKSPFKGLPVVACAHYYAANAQLNEEEHSERLVIGGQDCVDGDIFQQNISYVALGHIHREQRINEHTYYSGSALPMSFTERTYRHGVKCIDLSDTGEMLVRTIEYQPLRPLVTLPSKGAAEPAEILKLIHSLPERKKHDTGEDWPYLELRVLEKEPEPALLHQVTEALADRAVHFCRMVREHPQSKTEHQQEMTFEHYQQITPMELAEKVHQTTYQEEMRDELKARLLKTIEEVMADE